MITTQSCGDKKVFVADRRRFYYITICPRTREGNERANPAVVKDYYVGTEGLQISLYIQLEIKINAKDRDSPSTILLLACFLSLPPTVN